MSEHSKFLLADSQIPPVWVNVLPDLPEPLAPPLHPGTRAPLAPQDLAPIFPMELIQQEFSPQREIDIPGEVMDIYRLWRATPLYRARRLEKALDTPAHIYYKYEGTSPAGSHKPNTAIAQAYYNKRAGIRRLATETGAGQWGSALALACQLFGMECTVYMVRVSYDQKPYRRMMMNVWGAEVFASPSDHTNSGRAVLAAHPDSQGSLGIAISEAVEDAATHSDTNYSLGSVLNHVLLHQTVIGQEAKLQMGMAGEEPDVVIGCFGGGSNFGGLALPYVLDRLAARKDGAESTADRRRGADRLPQPDAWQFRLRLRRPGQAHSSCENVYIGARFRTTRHPCGWSAVPRSVPADQPPGAFGRDCREGVFPTPGLRGGGAVRPNRGHSSSPGIGPCHSRGSGRSY